MPQLEALHLRTELKENIDTLEESVVRLKIEEFEDDLVLKFAWG